MTNEITKIGVIQWTASHRVFDIWATINRHYSEKEKCERLKSNEDKIIRERFTYADVAEYRASQ